MPYRVLWDSAQESILEWCYELKKGGFNPKTYLDLGASAGQILTVVERVWGLENIKGVLIDGNDSVQKVNWSQHTTHPFKGKSYENYRKSQMPPEQKYNSPKNNKWGTQREIALGKEKLTEVRPLSSFKDVFRPRHETVDRFCVSLFLPLAIH